MRSEAPALMPVFRSRLQAELLTLLLLHPDTEYSLGELARILDVPLPTLHGEAKRLVAAGILADRTLGRHRLVRADTTHPAARALTDLVAVTFGPKVVVEEEFGGLPDTDLVLIFGSWAARYAGDPGTAPHDVDVLVVGRPGRDLMYAAADRAQRRLALPVNPVLASPARWAEATDALMRQIRASPHVTVVQAAEGVEAI